MEKRSMRPITNKIEVQYGNVEKALRQFKKKTKRSGLVEECRRRKHHVTKGERERLKVKKGIKRAQKLNTK